MKTWQKRTAQYLKEASAYLREVLGGLALVAF